jgi:hypothetical protein
MNGNPNLKKRGITARIYIKELKEYIPAFSDAD